MSDADFDPLARLLESRVEDAGRQGVGGLAWSVSRRGQVWSGSAGWFDVQSRRHPMPGDALFRIASVSKPIVAVAALQLVDQGLIGLDDAVDSVLPELAERRVLVDPTGPLDGPTVPADRPLTLRDLLTFRCGLGMDFDFDTPQPVLDQLWEWGIGPGPSGPEVSPDEFMARLGRLPLSDQPGSRWRYHTGSDIVSVLIERLRGESLDQTLARDVFGPLGMDDTAFWLTSAQSARLGPTRSAGDDGRPTVVSEPADRWTQPPLFRSGAAGLVSATADLVAFGQMLLDGGVSPSGRRLLSEDLVAEMTTDQLTSEQADQARIGDGTELGWGLGLAVRRRSHESGWPSLGSYTWDGGRGSRLVIDPPTDTVAVLLLTDDFSSPGVTELLDDFVDAVAAAFLA